MTGLMLPFAHYLDVIEQLKKLITGAGKKYYVFVVGKLNVAKLANFQEIDIFVIVACPENTLIDSKQFFKPIVTPFELQLALGRYSLSNSSALNVLKRNGMDRRIHYRL